MNYHNRMMNIQDDVSGGMSPGENRVAYKVGHKDARHAAAEIALEADAEIERLRYGYERLISATDTEMGDGDLAREIAREMLRPNGQAQPAPGH